MGWNLNVMGWNLNVKGKRADEVDVLKLRGIKGTCRTGSGVRIYKAVHSLGNGVFTSIWAGGDQPHTQLNYVSGYVTQSVGGGQGIYTQESPENARKQARGDLGHVEHPTAVLYGHGVGAKNRMGRYDAVYIEGVDWLEDRSHLIQACIKSEPVWEDVTDECYTEEEFNGKASVYHDNNSFSGGPCVLTLGKTAKVNKVDGYRVTFRADGRAKIERRIDD